MPLTDDGTIPANAVLLRALPYPSWITNKRGTRRPSSAAFFSTRQEVSYFLEAPGILTELRRILQSSDFARVPASVIRGLGLVIERRPAECPLGFRGDPASHVVVGPPEQMQRNEYEKRARSIAKHPNVSLVVPDPPPQ